jgi:DNA-directed RNA polymerase specialized sigma24 family protein
LASGEAEALAPLMVFCYPAIRRTIRDRVLPDLIKDCVQDTSLRVWQAVKNGRFRNEGVPQFVKFVKTIAWREARSYYRYAAREDPLSYERDGEEVERDLPSPESAGQAVEHRLLLNDLLDKALIHSAADQPGKDAGLLKKMAFQSFYVDHLPQPEIATQLKRHALTAQLEISITEDVLNNWLSGGRILKAVIEYVVRHSGKELAQLIELAMPVAKLTEGERGVLLLRWCGGKDVAAIAAERNISRDEVEKALKKAFDKLVGAIKGQLHDARKLGP